MGRLRSKLLRAGGYPLKPREARLPLFKLIEFLNRYLAYIQDNTYDMYMNGTTNASMEKGFRFIYNEMMFFGTTAILVSIVFGVRLIVSLWRVRNTNRV